MERNQLEVLLSIENNFRSTIRKKIKMVMLLNCNKSSYINKVLLHSASFNTISMLSNKLCYDIY